MNQPTDITDIEFNAANTPVISHVEDVDQSDFIGNEFLTEVKGEQPVSSSMFEAIFLNHNRLPKKIRDQFADNPEEVEKLILGEKPILSTSLRKPYWKQRAYDEINVDIYGAVALAADRHVLDVIIGNGSLILDAHKYSLRQVLTKGIKLTNVAWDLIPEDQVDSKLKNHGVYFHIDLNELCVATGLKPAKKNREMIIARLQRLSLMTLRMTPMKDGKPTGVNSRPISFVDPDFITILDTAKIRNGIFDAHTRTDLIVNISMYYANSLKDDGIISRKRLKSSYPNLVGKNSVEDFYKTLDSHKREWLHGKSLRTLIQSYFDNKISNFGMNISHKVETLFDQVVTEEHKLRRYFNLSLKPTIRNRKRDCDFHYINTETGKKEISCD